MTKKDTQAEAGYRYKRLTPKLLFDDFSFDKRSPQPGDKAPEFELQTVDGKTIQSADILSGRPVLLTFGSMSCPMTASSISPLQRLHAEFGDKVFTAVTPQRHVRLITRKLLKGWCSFQKRI